MKEIIPENEFAKEVYDLADDADEHLIKIKRPLKLHESQERLPLDIDVKMGNIWFYWGSSDSIENAKKELSKRLKRTLGKTAEARIVDAVTSKIILVLK